MPQITSRKATILYLSMMLRTPKLLLAEGFDENLIPERWSRQKQSLLKGLTLI